MKLASGVVVRIGRNQIEAEAPDGYHFDDGPHVLVEATMHGSGRAEARADLMKRLRQAKLEKCDPDCDCGSGGAE